MHFLLHPSNNYVNLTIIISDQNIRSALLGKARDPSVLAFWTHRGQPGAPLSVMEKWEWNPFSQSHQRLLEIGFEPKSDDYCPLG